MKRNGPEIQERLRGIRPINDWLTEPAVGEFVKSHGRAQVLAELREVLTDLRIRILAGEILSIDSVVIDSLSVALSRRMNPGLRHVINATGILLHTGLGRAPLSKKAACTVRDIASVYCNLEFDLETGMRGRRIDLIRETIRSITGAEAATVVNNNAAATILALRAVAGGREVLVSRGQLVEIGGGFRLPEIMAVSGAKLREVGTTNKTRIADFTSSIGPETAAILRIHTSNYAIIGFTEEPESKELAAIAHDHGLVFIDDIGSGALTSESVPAGRNDPSVTESLANKADLVLFSGDKLLGGPQCGIILGSKECVAKVERDPLMRAFRVDKLILAALSSTLNSWRDPEVRNKEIPFWRMISETTESLQSRGIELAQELNRQGWNASVQNSVAYAGGGSLPSERIESRAVVLRSPWPEQVESEGRLGAMLRQGVPAIVGRLHSEALWIDLRSVFPEEDEILSARLRDIIQRG